MPTEQSLWIFEHLLLSFHTVESLLVDSSVSFDNCITLQICVGREILLGLIFDSIGNLWIRLILLAIQTQLVIIKTTLLQYTAVCLPLLGWIHYETSSVQLNLIFRAIQYSIIVVRGSFSPSETPRFFFFLITIKLYCYAAIELLCVKASQDIQLLFLTRFMKQMMGKSMRVNQVYHWHYCSIICDMLIFCRVLQAS